MLFGCFGFRTLLIFFLIFFFSVNGSIISLNAQKMEIKSISIQPKLNGGIKSLIDLYLDFEYVEI
ncbi:hypothetical protein RchiOBHm_Chr2g0161221 [Rosa chinensis]|uniref:Uncharacterized protein n=1 Tax=Rosa chinensis TaxID=74649 RepID=A0A2P6S2R3_ROSCH|nr:hypothetical protein RchiOBHm_Chr2g0161221 [Rosa chinensis]